MQHDEEGPEQQHVPQPDEAEKQGHVDAALVAEAVLHHDGVAAVGDGADEGEDVADGDLRRRFVWERASVLVRVAGDVDAGDEGYAGERGEDADEFADGEFLDGVEGADEQGPDAGCGCENRGGCDGRVVQASGDEVVCREPEEAEGET